MYVASSDQDMSTGTNQGGYSWAKKKAEKMKKGTMPQDVYGTADRRGQKGRLHAREVQIIMS